METELSPVKTGSTPDSVGAQSRLEGLKHFEFRWSEFFHTEEGPSTHFCTRLGWRAVLAEWSVIFVTVLAYCWGFLDLGTQRLLTGMEVESYLSTARLLADSLANYGQFPLWNPYLRSGAPFVADTMLYIYNPLAILPVFLLGVVDGFKVAVWLSFLAAGLGMWWFGAVLGVGRAARLWMALMFAFTGSGVARFFQGQYLLTLGFPWIVWSIASLMATVRTRRPVHAAMAAISLALTYFSGHLYYSYYMVFVVALFVSVAVLDLRREHPFLALHLDRAKIIGAVGLLAAALIALEALPMLELMPRIVGRGVDLQVNTSHNVEQIILDYVSKDPRRSDAIKPWLQPEEYYAYTGYVPLLGLLLIPLALLKRRRMPIFFLSLLLSLLVAWITVQNMPWRELYAGSYWVHQFRYPTRLLIFGACALVALSGLGMDALWDVLKGRTSLRVGLDARSLPGFGRAAALGVLAAVMIWSVADVYGTNRQYARTRDPQPAIDEAMSWLRTFDPSETYVAYGGDRLMTATAHRLRFYNPVYWFEDLRPLSGIVNRRPVNARPNYWILNNAARMDDPNAVAVRRFANDTAYRMTRSLPYAFAVKNEKLMDPAGGKELEAADVTALAPRVPGPNGVEVTAEGEAGSALVVLTARYPGWEVTVDGRKQPLKNVGGYLATDMLPGTHKYVFTFSSTPFAVGLPISLLALVVTLYLLAGAPRLEWRSARAQVSTWRPRGFWTGLRGAPEPASLPADNRIYSAKVQSGIDPVAVEEPAIAGGAASAHEEVRSVPRVATKGRAATGSAAPVIGEAPAVDAMPAADGLGSLRCPWCGRDNPWDGRFCNRCGSPIAPPDARPVGGNGLGEAVAGLQDQIHWLTERVVRLETKRAVRWPPGEVGTHGSRGGPSHRLRWWPPVDAGGALARVAVATKAWLQGHAATIGWLSTALSLEWVLFGSAMLVYTATRLWALEDFPIYFFCDEAYEALFGQQLLARGFRDPQGALFPIFFEPAPQRWVPQLSVYLNAVAVGLFGKSIIVTRGTSALVTVFGVAGVALILKLVFRARFWWAGALLMGIMPAWFIHSRTAFNWVTMTTFYTWFLLFYLLYRTRSPRYLFPAILLGAATFYTYNTQAVVAALAVALFLSDLRYHLRQRRTVLLGLALLGVLALPLVGFRLAHPTAVEDQLRVIGSYWFQTIPLEQKLQMFGQRYLQGLSPQYWFFPNGVDLVRHIMKGYGHIRVEMLPLWALGVALCLWRVRSSPHRAVLLATLAVPTAAAMAEVGIGRVLAFVAPASILIALGMEALLRRVPRRVPLGLQATALFAALTLASLGMLREALAEGPTWFRDYGLYGMQWGAKQLFKEAIPEYLRRDPNARVYVSPTWANGTDSFLGFFLTPEQRTRVEMPSVDYFLSDRRELTPSAVVVLPPWEYQRAQASGKFKSISVEKTIPYPDGQPGFYFLRLTYVDNIAALIAAEKEARRQLVEGQVVVNGEAVRVRHSLLDGGTVAHMFDGDRFTLARGAEANPFVLELIFPRPRPLEGLAFDFGSMDFTLTAAVYGEGATEPTTYTETYRRLPPDPHVEMDLDRGPQTVSRVRVEIKNLLAGDTTNIHIREVAFR